MANVRSPNYPAYGLPEAIDRIRKVYDKEHTHKAPREVIAKALGYQGLNGKSLTVLSTLKKYGLLEDVGKDLKVSNDALTILVEPSTSIERAEAIRRAAFAPVLFDEIRKNYGEAIPSNENLRAYLLRKGFLQGAVDAPIRAYRETIELVNGLQIEDNGGNLITSEDMAMNTDTQTGKLMQPAKLQPHGISSMSLPYGAQQVGSAIPVTSACSMTIIADGEVTQEGLDRLTKYIELIKEWFPKGDQTVQ